jgi:hypothetical protein
VPRGGHGHSGHLSVEVDRGALDLCRQFTADFLQIST